MKTKLTMIKKSYIAPSTCIVVLGGSHLLQAVSVDPSKEGNQQDAESRRRRRRQQWDDEEDEW